MHQVAKYAGAVAVVALIALLVIAANEAARRRGIEVAARLADVVSPRPTI